MAKIKEITASQILNAKGAPTIETSVFLSDGKVGISSFPQGAQTDETLSIKDPQTAITIINKTIAPILVGLDAQNQQQIDKAMIDLDGTQNKSQLGANATITVSMAVAKASAESSVLPLFIYLRQLLKKDYGLLKIPVPIFNLINGIKRENNLSDFHEFLIIPASSKTYMESVQIGEIVHNQLKKVLEGKTSDIFSEYEEGFTLNLKTNKEAFLFIQQAVEETRFKLGFDLFLGLNSQAGNFFKNGKYNIKDAPSDLSPNDLINYYEDLNKNIHLLYLEDALSPDDWDAWKLLFDKLAPTTIIAGGDLIAGNPYRLETALERKTINALVIKPNQVGTVIEALALSEAAKDIGLKIIVSHRNNETNDDFMADFAVAVSADYVKIGSIARGENIAKYNRLMQIENQLKIL